ncbi:UNVERIFIED_ORG: (2R)-3-sulfolactate dehydrogenase (NADP+) [Variovorax paradoxus]|nr:(2R)-3-sulfolactate dehydrogenase (NADP+) [Variovorax paradoxus]
MHTTTVSIQEFEAIAAAALQCHGASEVASREVAKALRRAQQRGNPHCGLGHLEIDCRQLLCGRVDGQAVPTKSLAKTGLIQVNAANGFAQPAFSLGLSDALSCVEALGVAVLAISRAYTCAALGYFPERIAEHGFIGIAFTNASASVAAPDGAKPILGTNPIAMSVPDGKGGIAFQFDQCTSAANLRHVRQAAQRGDPIPAGWAVTRDGTPTVDAAEALAGALLSSGGNRGFGIGLMVEILASFFTSSAMSLETKSLQQDSGPPHGLGVFCLLLDPTAIAGDQFWVNLGRLQDAILAQPGTRLPGTRKDVREEIAVESTMWEKAQSLAASPFRRE